MSAVPCILVTGFEPFGGATVNPSERVALALDGGTIGGARVHGRVLPCTFAHALPVLRRAVEQLRPSIVLSLGQAAGRAGLTVERVAINVADARMPDNEGAQPIDEDVVPGAEAAHFASLLIKAMVAAIEAEGVPASVSQTAGTFVCNHVFYGLMHHLRGRPDARGGFLHLPLLPEQVRADAPAPSLPLERMVAGVRAALAAALGTHADVRLAGGTEH